MHRLDGAPTKQVVVKRSVDASCNAVFNHAMTDAELIAELGGPTRLAERLGYEKPGGVQRVQNWLARGIPPKVKLEHPELFLQRIVVRRQSTPA